MFCYYIQQYNYRVKIINTEKRSEFVVREMRSHRRRFDSILEVKMAIKSEFKDSVPSGNNFQVGYFLGKRSSKHWLISPDDLPSMYQSLGSKHDVMLWCDGAKSLTNEDADVGGKRSSPNNPPPSKRRLIEDKVDETVAELKLRHESKYTLTQMRLWARMIAANHHESLDDPPEVPAITGVVPKRKKRESVAEAISTLAGAIRGTPQDNTLPGTSNSSPPAASTSNSSPPAASTSNSTSPGTSNNSDSNSAVEYSPRKKSELRMKYLQELRELQQLLEQNVLTQEEFAEQKAIVLAALRKLA